MKFNEEAINEIAEKENLDKLAAEAKLRAYVLSKAIKKNTANHRLVRMRGEEHRLALFWLHRERYRREFGVYPTQVYSAAAMSKAFGEDIRQRKISRWIERLHWLESEGIWPKSNP